MCIRYLGFVLLICFPAVLHAQSAAQTCAAPGLDGGFFSPKQETYSHGTKLTYTCNDGRKLAVKGSWATVTCQNGKWSPEPQCIDEQACFPPTIPNAKYTESATGWYEEGRKIRITCDEGYDPKDVTTTCTNGAWSPLPVCERSIDACDEPPRIPHAIVTQEYQEVFAAGSEVTYVCEDGYTTEEGARNMSIYCTAGNWTEGPTCIINCGAHPVVDNGVVVEEEQRFVKYKCADFYNLVGSDTVVCNDDGTWSQPPVCEEAFCVLKPGEYVGGDLRLSTTEYLAEGETKILPCVQRSHSAVAWCTNGEITFTSCRKTRPGTGHGGGSSGSTTRPAGGGSSDGRDSPRVMTRISHCGAHPVVDNGVVVKDEPMFLKYKCAALYNLVGSDTVTCFSDGSWSPLPVCEEAFCVLKPGEYAGGHVRISAIEHVAEGEKKIPCVQRFFSATVQCRNRELTFTSRCCHFYYPSSCILLDRQRPTVETRP